MQSQSRDLERPERPALTSSSRGLTNHSTSIRPLQPSLKLDTAHAGMVAQYLSSSPLDAGLSESSIKILVKFHGMLDAMECCMVFGPEDVEERIPEFIAVVAYVTESVVDWHAGLG